MFSVTEKKMIAKMIEELLLSFSHPEMPTEKPEFHLHIKGKEDWSYADIEPNHHFEIDEVDCPTCDGGKMLMFLPCHTCRGHKKVAKNTNSNPWNEVARDILEEDCPVCRGGKDKAMLLTDPLQEKKCSNCNGTNKVVKNTNPNPWNEVARDVLEGKDWYYTEAKYEGSGVFAIYNSDGVFICEVLGERIAKILINSVNKGI